jgi:hypothetical protein
VRTRAAITFVLLVVLALRSLLPVGYMVQAADISDGSPFEIVICTSSGTKILAVDADGKQVPSKPQHVDNGLCPFAASGAAALASAEPKTLVGAAEYASVTYTLVVALFAETPKPGAASARGPPSTALI